LIAQSGKSHVTITLTECAPHTLEQGFPTWGTNTPRGTFGYPKGYI